MYKCVSVCVIAWAWGHAAGRRRAVASSLRLAAWIKWATTGVADRAVRHLGLGLMVVGGRAELPCFTCFYQCTPYPSVLTTVR